MPCENIENCSILKEYGEKEGFSQAVAGFRMLYCEGDNMEKCLRRKLAKKLGGPDKLPSNMMPNGLPLTGTDSNEWPQNVLDALNEERANQQS